MNNPLRYLAVTSTLFLAMPAAHAELPQITEKPWLGYFLGLKQKKFQFGITSKGEVLFEPLKRDGAPINIHNPVKVHFEILETMPDGQVVSKQVKDETLASTSPAVQDPEKPVVITGNVTGDAAFEVAIIPEREGFSITGRVTDKGTLTNPLTFAVTMDFNPYQPEKMEDSQMKNFMKKIKRDEFRLDMHSGKHEKIDFDAEGNPATIFPEGFKVVELRADAYDGAKFEFTATEKSKIILEDKGDRPLWKGFSLRWLINEGADATKEKFTINAK